MSLDHRSTKSRIVYRYYATIPSSVPDADGIKFITDMKAALEENQPQTFFKEYGASSLFFSLKALAF